MPGLVAAYKEIKNLSNNVIVPAFGFKLFDTYGLDEETIIKVSQALNLQFDIEDFRNEIENAKIRSRQQIASNDYKIYDQLITTKLQTTKDLFKYEYSKKNGNYVFDKLKVKLLKVIRNNTSVMSIEPGMECSVVLDKNNIYTEAGGQVSDKGCIEFDNGEFQINNSHIINGYIIHKGILTSNNKQPVEVNSVGYLEFDKVYRLNSMRNHTATHLLNSVLKQLKGATCQKSSKVTSKYLNLDVGIFGNKLTLEDIRKIEEQINSVISKSIKVKTLEIDSQKLLNLDNVILVPGEVYPDNGIRLIEIVGSDFQSR